MIKNIIIIILCVAVILQMTIIYTFDSELVNINIEPKIVETAKTVTVKEEIAETDYMKLKGNINSFIERKDGKWAVYIKNLNTNETIEINNRKMVSASLIKLFIMAKTYDEIEKNSISLNENIEKLLSDMITISDNDSANKLVAIIGESDFQKGMAMVNAFAKLIGCNNTEQQRDMLNQRPIPIKEENYTSVRDCGILLEKIYNKNCVSKEYDENMLSLLLKQTRRNKIPAGIPKGIKVANKTGELKTTENDVAIIYSPKCTYVICIMVNELNYSKETQKNISDLSSLVYKHFVRD